MLRNLTSKRIRNMTGFTRAVNLLHITTRRVIHMTFVKHAGLWRRVWDCALLGSTRS
jgi:hypothetical protein